MLVRVVRGVIGSLLLLVGLPLLLAGGTLWFAMQHRDSGGAYTASLAGISTEGHAVVVSDVDGLLRRDVPFARSGRTSLRVTAETATGPAFIGLAPASDVADYLAGVPYTRIQEVRLARGHLPVTTAPVAGRDVVPGLPHEQPFWAAASGAGVLEWVPSEERGRQLALVIMDRSGAAPGTVDLEAELRPEWLSSATLGALVLGGVLVLVAVAALAWPSRSREVVYVVPPAQVPEVAAHLGVVVPPAGAATGSSPEPSPAASPEPAPAVYPEPAASPSPPPVPAGSEPGTPGPEPGTPEPVPVEVEFVDDAGAAGQDAGAAGQDAGEGERPARAEQPAPEGRPVAGAPAPQWPPLTPRRLTAAPALAPPAPPAPRDETG